MPGSFRSGDLIYVDIIQEDDGYFPAIVKAARARELWIEPLDGSPECIVQRCYCWPATWTFHGPIQK